MLLNGYRETHISDRNKVYKLMTLLICKIILNYMIENVQPFIDMQG
jgi:hypothetical protein